MYHSSFSSSEKICRLRVSLGEVPLNSWANITPRTPGENAEMGAVNLYGHCHGSMAASVTRLAVSVFILDEDSFVGKVAGECDSRYSETGEGALEAIPSGERACVSPCLTVDIVSDDVYLRAGWM